MARGIQELIFYGDDIRVETFPEDTRMFYAKPPLPGVADPVQTIRRALDHPVGAEPLEKQLNKNSTVTIAFDDPCLPIPLMRNDPRGLIIQELLRRLAKIGVSRKKIRLICANGLHRKFTLKELSAVLGRRVVRRLGPERIECHDATLPERLVDLGSTESGREVVIHRAVKESDITIYVNVNFTSMNGGWKSILVGLGAWQSIRHHHTPMQWNGVDSIMEPEKSPMHLALAEMGERVAEKCNVFQIETVINNRVWPAMLSGLLSPIGPDADAGPGKTSRGALFRAASVSPQGMKRWIRNRLRSDYRLVDAHAGAIERIHPLTLEKVYAQQNVQVDSPVDILIFGVPNLSPYSVFSVFNPILLRGLVLGYLRGLYRGRPLVKENGVIIALNPGFEKFHAGHHPSYIDFWERDLADYTDPEVCWSALSESYAHNQKYLEKYRNGYAYHGTHALINWMWSGMAMRHVNGVILAGAREPETARKIGFIPADSLESAIDMARDMAGKTAAIGYQVIPPLFSVAAAGT